MCVLRLGRDGDFEERRGIFSSPTFPINILEISWARPLFLPRAEFEMKQCRSPGASKRKSLWVMQLWSQSNDSARRKRHPLLISWVHVSAEQHPQSRSYIWSKTTPGQDNFPALQKGKASSPLSSPFPSSDPTPSPSVPGGVHQGSHRPQGSDRSPRHRHRDVEIGSPRPAPGSSPFPSPEVIYFVVCTHRKQGAAPCSPPAMTHQIILPPNIPSGC